MPETLREAVRRATPPEPRTDPEYHEHVAGDRHAHAYNGPHSHGGVPYLVTPPEPVEARDPIDVHINDGSAHDHAMAWSEGHTDGFDEARADLRARVGTNLHVYQRRIDAGTGTDFDRGKAAAFRVVLSMLDDRPHEPTFSCARPSR